MNTTTLGQLVEVLSTEIELTEALVEVLKSQRQALVRMDADSLAGSVYRQQQLLKPIQGLEQERMRLMAEALNCTEANSLTRDEINNGIEQLLTGLEKGDNLRLKSVRNRLKEVVEEMVELNRGNKTLLENSRKFVRETIKIVTEGYSRQLVNQKI